MTEICGTDAGQRDLCAEDPAVAGERRGALLHARPAGLDEADDRHAARARRAASTRTIVSACALAERAAEERAVLREQATARPSTRAGRAENAVAGDGSGAEPARATRERSSSSEPGSQSASRRSSGRQPLTGGARRRASCAAPRSTSDGVVAAEAERVGDRDRRPAVAGRSGRASPGRSRDRARGRAPRSRASAAISRARSVQDVAIASTAPAAPSRWPIADFVEDTGTSRGAVAERAFIAVVSARSLSGVEVPWALT